MTHATFKALVSLALGGQGVTTFENPNGFDERACVRYGLIPGASDLVGWTPDGRFLAVEIKVGRDRLSKSQRTFLYRLNEAGGVGLEVRCGRDLESSDDITPWARESYACQIMEVPPQATLRAAGVSSRYITS